MRVWKCAIVLFGLLFFAGCGGQKSTDALISDLKSPQASDRDRTAAVRLLPQRKGDGARVVPALIEALKDKEDDIRWSAAIGLGYFGSQARDAIPALQTALGDHDARVREGARVALSRIDPAQFPDASTPKSVK